MYIEGERAIACKAWLQITCIPSQETTTPAPRPFPILLNEQIHLGNQISHISNKLVKFRGVIYCSACGGRFGSNQMRGLARQCAPPTDAGETLLKCMLDNKLPAGYTSWPEESP